MYQQTLGRFLSRDPLAENGMDVMTDTGFYGARLAAMRANPWYYGGNGENLYTYVDNNPVNFTDPSGLAVIPRKGCRVWIHCWSVYGLGTHCGLTICSERPYGCEMYDGATSTGSILPPYGCLIIKRRKGVPVGEGKPDYGPPVDLPPSVCDCIARYRITFNNFTPCRNYDPTDCNSNWALTCMLKSCGLTVTTTDGSPPFIGTAAHRCRECAPDGWVATPGPMGGGVCTCLKWNYFSCP